MAGTLVGGRRAAQTNILKYGEDFYKEIGRKGGLKGHTGGFWANRDLARTAGAKGGKISKRVAKPKPVAKAADRKWWDIILRRTK